MKRILLCISVCFGLCSTYAQEDSASYHFATEIHYQSKGIGPQMYLYSGDVLKISYMPTIGSVELTMVNQTSSSKFEPQFEVLLAQQKDTVSFEYNVPANGCYTLTYKPDGSIGYAHAVVQMTRNPVGGKANAPTTCFKKPKQNIIVPGNEVTLTPAEVAVVKWKDSGLSAKKEVMTTGFAYCYAPFELRGGQSALINVAADDNDVRTNFQIYKENDEGQLNILMDYQFGVTDFGFKSLSGGTYVVKYYGIGVFKRADDLSIRLSQ
ncbi:MAG: hypothetical protein JXQ90_01545 [Cyclobacteriaceae bacterium]